MDTPRNGEAQNKKKRPRPSITPKPENGVPSEYFLSANATHTVGVGITGPPPPFSRVLVRRFAEVNRLIDSEITRHLALCTQPYQDVDLEYAYFYSNKTAMIRWREYQWNNN